MRSKNRRLALLFLFLLGSFFGKSQDFSRHGDTTRTLLPNGWYLTPAGTSIPLSSDLPLNIALAPDGRHAAVTNNGNGIQTIDLVDLHSRRVTAAVPIAKAWLGLAFDKDQLYASGGNDDIIRHYKLAGDTLLPVDTLILGKPWPAVLR